MAKAGWSDSFSLLYRDCSFLSYCLSVFTVSVRCFVWRPNMIISSWWRWLNFVVVFFFSSFRWEYYVVDDKNKKNKSKSNVTASKCVQILLVPIPYSVLFYRRSTHTHTHTILHIFTCRRWRSDFESEREKKTTAADKIVYLDELKWFFSLLFSFMCINMISRSDIFITVI